MWTRGKPLTTPGHISQYIRDVGASHRWSMDQICNPAIPVSKGKATSWKTHADNSPCIASPDRSNYPDTSRSNSDRQHYCNPRSCSVETSSHRAQQDRRRSESNRATSMPPPSRPSYYCHPCIEQGPRCSDNNVRHRCHRRRGRSSIADSSSPTCERDGDDEAAHRCESGIRRDNRDPHGAAIATSIEMLFMS
jgi:hypothetical protein